MAAALIAALTAFGVYTLTGPRATRALIEPVAAPRDEPRSARLVIAPSDAAAQIDGSPARARDGILILAGEIGSQHQVRLSRGDQVVETLVLLTADGPRPPAIELLPPGARASNTPAPPASSLLIREHLE
jgi:serine/threonine-protein kinase